MRALVAATVLVLTVVTVASAAGQQTPPSSYGEAVFLVSGRGYGHGVGMSQYGAYGQALAGRTYDQILAHYYTGTELGKAGRKEVRVLLAEGRRAVTISSSLPFIAVDATGATYRLPKGPLTVRPDLSIPSEAGLAPGDSSRSSFGRPRRHRSRSTVASTAASSSSSRRPGSFAW